MVAEITTVMRMTPDEIKKVYDALDTVREFVDFYIDNVDKDYSESAYTTTIEEAYDLLEDKREDTIIR